MPRTPSSRATRPARTRSSGPTTPAGCRIQRFEAYNEEEEAEWIARQVESLVAGRGSALTRKADEEEERFRARDIAVMYRMNAQSRAIEESFLRYGLRYQLVGGTRFYARREVKDALAYLRILRSDTDSVSFERIINVPARGIGDKTVEVLRAAAAREGGTTWGAIEEAARGELPAIAPRARSLLADFAALVRRLRARIGVLALPELLDEVLEASGYRAMLADGSEDGEERWANLLELRGGHDPLRRPVAGGRARPAARGDRARRRPGLVRGRCRRGDPHHAPRRQGPRVPGRVHRRAWRRASSRTAGRSMTRRSSRRSAGSPTSGSPEPSGGCTCRTPGGG